MNSGIRLTAVFLLLCSLLLLSCSSSLVMTEEKTGGGKIAETPKTAGTAEAPETAVAELDYENLEK